MTCPRCNGDNLGKGGSYSIQRSKIKIVRLRCKDCGKMFSLKNKSYRKKIPIKIRKRILTLSKTKKYHLTKFDNTKKKTYSTREIARKLNVSKSFVHQIISDDVKRRGKKRLELKE